jgi:hypothetical protein
MSYGYLFVTDQPSKKLGTGRGKFLSLPEVNGKCIYFRYEDDSICLVEKDNDKFRFTIPGSKFLQDVGSEIGQFIFSYALLGNREGEEDYAKIVLATKPIRVEMNVSLHIQPRSVYLFANIRDSSRSK